MYLKAFFTDKEYRLMFLTSLMKLFAIDGEMTVDRHCTDEGRIFFAGKEIVVINKDAVVNSKAIIEAAKGIAVCENVSMPSSKRRTKRDKDAPNQMITAIARKDINTYKKLLSNAALGSAKADEQRNCGQLNIGETIIKNILFLNYCLPFIQKSSKPYVATVCDDIFELTSRLPLHLMLGLPLGEPFSCILPGHIDRHPSASINVLENGRYVYNCWSCIDPNEYYDALTVFSILMNAEISEALKFIVDAIGLSYETEWQHRQRDRIDQNRRFINSQYFKEKYECLYKDLVRANAFGLLKFYLEYARDHLSPTSLTEDGKLVFFVSMREASRLMKEMGIKGASLKAVWKKSTLLCMYGFMDKVEEGDMPKKLLNKAREIAQKNTATNIQKSRYRQDFFSIPPYTAEMFIQAQDFVKLNKQYGVRRKGMGREQSLRTFGEKATDSLFTQDVTRKHSRKSVKFYAKYEELVKTQISIEGITSEQEILSLLRGYKNSVKERLSKQCLPQLLIENEYQRIRVNKETRTEYNIPDRFKSKSLVILPK